MLTPPGHSAAHCGSPAPGAGPGQVCGVEQALRSEPAGVRRHAAPFLTGPTGVSVEGAVSEGGCGHRVEAGPRAWRAQLRAWHLHDEAAVRTRTRHPRPCTGGICRGRRVQRPNVAPPPRPLPEFIHQHRALRLRQVLVRARISVQLLKLPEPQSPGLQNQKSHCLAGPSDGRCGSEVPGVQPGIPIPRAGSGPGQTITPSCDWHAKAFPALLPGPQTQTSPVSTGHPTGLPRQSPRAHPGSRL